MAANNVVSTLRRSAPSVVQCFKNAQLYRREEVVTNKPPPETVVLFTWLGAKQKHAHKYAKCWTRRGHDVLYVTTSVRDLLFPRTGAEVTASRVVDFLDKRNSRIIVHGLSVGGYLTQLVLMQAKNSSINISHQIFDSFTNCTGMKAGVQNAVSPRYRGLATALIGLYIKYGDLSSVYKAQQFVESQPCPAPALFLHSMADEVSTYDDMAPILKAQSRTAPTTALIIPAHLRIPHVSLLKYLGEETYMGYIDKFVEDHRGLVCKASQDYSALLSVECIADEAFFPERMVLPQ